MIRVESPAPKTGADLMERQIQAAGADKAPQVTPEDIEAAIVGEHYFTAAHGRLGAIETGAYWGREHPARDEEDLLPLDLLTICVLVLKNGHTVTGEAFCQDPAKFDAAVGRSTARAVAVEKLWPMVVYAARSVLLTAQAPKQYKLTDVVDWKLKDNMDGTRHLLLQMRGGQQHRVVLTEEVVADARAMTRTDLQAFELVKQKALDILNRELAAGH